MTYKTAQTVGKKNAGQHRNPNNEVCTGPTATFPSAHYRLRDNEL